ncbi:MAG: hypothetical protein E7812_14125 [Phenylobacterium sp.]|nr:MAG: hypothetical protein E7812_14125 [Phenylobacterium sp.]
MWWRKTEKPLRQQLLEAQARLQRQIEILSLGPIRGRRFLPGSKEVLEAELREIEAALAELGPEAS